MQQRRSPPPHRSKREDDAEHSSLHGQTRSSAITPQGETKRENAGFPIRNSPKEHHSSFAESIRRIEETASGKIPGLTGKEFPAARAFQRHSRRRRHISCELVLRAGKCQLLRMTDKQAVMDALERLPENASLDEIAEELRIMAAIRRGRADIAAGRTKTQEQAGQLLESWASAWTSK